MSECNISLVYESESDISQDPIFQLFNIVYENGKYDVDNDTPELLNRRLSKFYEELEKQIPNWRELIRNKSIFDTALKDIQGMQVTRTGKKNIDFFGGSHDGPYFAEDLRRLLKATGRKGFRVKVEIF